MMNLKENRAEHTKWLLAHPATWEEPPRQPVHRCETPRCRLQGYLQGGTVTECGIACHRAPLTAVDCYDWLRSGASTTC